MADNFFGWPPNSPPKGLHHVDGEIILERIITIFREYGVNHIRLVVGYKAEMFCKFNEEKNLELEIVYNPSWKGDSSALHPSIVPEGKQDWLKGFESIKLGLAGVDDDVIITFGDVLAQRAIVKEIVENPNPLACCVSNIWRISRAYLKKFREEVIAINPIGIKRPFEVFFEKHKAVCGCMLLGMEDVDAYKATDEYKKSGKALKPIDNKYIYCEN